MKHIKSGTVKIALNLGFALLCIAIILFLLNAPEETTARLPLDKNHQQFYTMNSKKEAEQYCAECHADEKSEPLSADHPPGFRCLFCHKKSK